MRSRLRACMAQWGCGEGAVPFLGLCRACCRLASCVCWQALQETPPWTNQTEQGPVTLSLWLRTSPSRVFLLIHVNSRGKPQLLLVVRTRTGSSHALPSLKAFTISGLLFFRQPLVTTWPR